MLTLQVDRDVPDPDVAHDRVAVLGAPPERVWPWVVQLGDGRAGFYSLDGLERLVGLTGSVDGPRSLWRVEPSLQHLDVGDTVPLGRGQDLLVTACEPPLELTLLFDGRLGPARLRFGWAFLLAPVDTGTRLHVASRIAVDGAAPVRAMARLALDPGHRAMESVLLRNLRRRTG